MTERELAYYRTWNRRRRAQLGMRPTPHLQGPTVRVDTDHLRRLIERRGFTVREASMNAGLHETALYHVLKRGSCKEPTLDKLACSLGTHMYELEVTR